MRQKIIKKKDIRFIPINSISKSDADSYILNLRIMFNEFAENFRKHKGKIIVKVLLNGRFELSIDVNDVKLKEQMKKRFFSLAIPSSHYNSILI